MSTVRRVAPVDTLAVELANAGLPADQLDSDVRRFAGYHALAAHNADPAALIRAVSTERDLGVRSAVVAELLDRLPTDAHAALLSGLDGGPDEFNRRRADEIAACRRYLDDPGSLRPEDVAGMTPWLQRRLVETANSAQIASVLSEHGTTRKIRNAARSAMAGRGTAASTDRASTPPFRDSVMNA